MDIAHLTISTRGRFPLFDDPSACRRALHRLTTCRSAGLVLFALADDHAHLVTLEHRTSAARAAARIRQSLGACAGVPLDPPYVRPVETRRHLLWLLEYLLLQPSRHGLPGHAALWEGSCARDLLSARALPGLRLRIHRVLPRLRLRRIHEILGLPASDPLRPADNDLARALGPARVAAAAAAAAAADPQLRGRRLPEVLARAAAAQVAVASGISLKDVAWALQVDVRSVRRLLLRPANARAQEATRRCLALEEVVGRSSASCVERSSHPRSTRVA